MKRVKISIELCIPVYVELWCDVDEDTANDPVTITKAELAHAQSMSPRKITENCTDADSETIDRLALAAAKKVTS